jgi:hypothetical protein
MIARLRAGHRRVVGWVGVVALAGFVAAMATRPPPPVRSDSWFADTLSWAAFGPGGQIRAALTADGRLAIARGPRLIAPDLLVYWEPLPPDYAGLLLLGGIGDAGVHSFELPPGALDGIINIQGFLQHTTHEWFPVRAIPELE